MSKRKIVILIFRLFMLYLVFELLWNLSNFFSAFPDLEPRFYIGELGRSIAAAISLTLVFLLWRKTAWLKTSGTLASSDAPARWLTPLENPYIIVVSIIGVWEVYHNISGVLDNVSFMYQPKLGSGAFDMLLVGVWTGHLIVDSIGALLGAWLFILPWQLLRMKEKFELHPNHSEQAEISPGT